MYSPLAGDSKHTEGSEWSLFKGSLIYLPPPPPPPPPLNRQSTCLSSLPPLSLHPPPPLVLSCRLVGLMARRPPWGKFGGAGGGGGGAQSVVFWAPCTARCSVAGSNLLWASGRGDCSLVVNMSSESSPRNGNSNESIYRGLVCAHTHSFARTKKNLPFMSKTFECRQQKYTQHAPFTKTECDYLYGWIKERPHTQKFQPKWCSPEIQLKRGRRAVEDRCPLNNWCSRG